MRIVASHARAFFCSRFDYHTPQPLPSFHSRFLHWRIPLDTYLPRGWHNLNRNESVMSNIKLWVIDVHVPCLPGEFECFYVGFSGATSKQHTIFIFNERKLVPRLFGRVSASRQNAIPFLSGERFLKLRIFFLHLHESSFD